MSLNQANIIGNLGQDPEIRSGPNYKVANFTVATTVKWKDKNTGEKKERTEWHRIEVWGEGLIDHVISKYLRKGSQVFVQGELRTEKWQDKDGNDRYTTKIVVGGRNTQVVLVGSGGGNAGGGNAGGGQSSMTGAQDRTSYELDDDIPF